ncbi:MAG: UDP-N-acetylmuramoyl-L-alanine--D-glutamate ligase, partial [Leptolyngbyaceae cyanobacterium SL_5_14]|nr:UDP-N-acetylmuramoyl-L-alanine--D-glutamate ligase [Leptolyngbyaceae cyanobacterium SL_5_14]
MAHAYVIGLGKSGIAAARLLQRSGWDVTVSDRSASATLQPIQHTLEAAGIHVKLGDSFTPDPAWIQRVVVSPGVPWDLPALVKARDMGIEIMGEMELAWRSLDASPWVCITGTNGKTTTTALIAAIFQAAGLQAPACGNIGFAASNLALQTLETGTALDWVIAEVSSYQSEACSTLTPQIAVWTTFTPDHLSRHYTLENYYAIKSRLLNRSHLQVLNGDDPYLSQHAVHQWQDACWTSVQGKAHVPANLDRAAYIEDHWAVFAGEPIAPVASLRMVGAHNQQNLLMAIATARLAGIEKAAIAHAIATFPGVPHRLEHICTWQGIDFINDSKATNYDAAAVGLAAVAHPAILIAGGEAKAGDDSGWLQRIHQAAASVLL